MQKKYACMRYLHSRITVYHACKIDLRHSKALHSCVTCRLLHLGLPCSAIHYGVCQAVSGAAPTPKTAPTSKHSGLKPVSAQKSKPISVPAAKPVPVPVPVPAPLPKPVLGQQKSGKPESGLSVETVSGHGPKPVLVQRPKPAASVVPVPVIPVGKKSSPQAVDMVNNNTWPLPTPKPAQLQPSPKPVQPNSGYSNLGPTRTGMQTPVPQSGPGLSVRGGGGGQAAKMVIHSVQPATPVVVRTSSEGSVTLPGGGVLVRTGAETGTGTPSTSIPVRPGSETGTGLLRGGGPATTTTGDQTQPGIAGASDVDLNANTVDGARTATDSMPVRNPTQDGAEQSQSGDGRQVSIRTPVRVAVSRPASVPGCGGRSRSFPFSPEDEEEEEDFPAFPVSLADRTQAAVHPSPAEKRPHSAGPSTLLHLNQPAHPDLASPTRHPAATSPTSPTSPTTTTTTTTATTGVINPASAAITTTTSVTVDAPSPALSTITYPPPTTTTTTTATSLSSPVSPPPFSPSPPANPNLPSSLYSPSGGGGVVVVVGGISPSSSQASSPSSELRDPLSHRGSAASAPSPVPQVKSSPESPASPVSSASAAAAVVAAASLPSSSSSSSLPSPSPSPSPSSLAAPPRAAAISPTMVVMAGRVGAGDGEDIPPFHFPRGKPGGSVEEEVAGAVQRVGVVLGQLEGERASLEHMGDVAKACGYPLYWKSLLYRGASGDLQQGYVTLQSFSAMLHKLYSSCHDEASRFVALLAKPGCMWLDFDDFVPLIQDIVDGHPGLSFLQDAPEFHSRYIHTVVSRIFFCVNRSWTGRITVPELRRSDFLRVLAVLEDEEDINRVTDYFSYEHFYVIYCKFWELDKDHDLFIDREDLTRHNDQALNSRLIDRIFSGAVTRGQDFQEGRMPYREFVWFLIAEEDKKHPTSIEYWFRCMDLDGDGVISMYEMEHFYEEQMQKMESLGIEKLPFHDCLCQMFDLVRPRAEERITLSDLKNCRMADIFFDTFFNLDKFLEHEQRDPFAATRELDSNGREMSDWDRYAAEEYDILVAEEGLNEPEEIHFDEDLDLEDDDSVEEHVQRLTESPQRGATPRLHPATTTNDDGVIYDFAGNDLGF
ncbi:uncharacterized protein LOC143288820 isoform X3 [Babylonia areolata]|uniref:uncharacterized protein LOC143288820 isoform X2 n=1 Tax=Babylonia areolata TaxID=304850 RepID=UPI003FD1AF73